MTSEKASQLFDIAMLVLAAGGFSMLAHFTFSVALRSRIPVGDALLGEVFGSPAWGDLTRHPWLVRAHFFWPWMPSPAGMVAGDGSTRILFFGARIAGMGTVVGFLGFLAMMVYIGVRSA